MLVKLTKVGGFKLRGVYYAGGTEINFASGKV